MILRYPYKIPTHFSSDISLEDHLGGFDSNGLNLILEKINSYASGQNTTITISYHQILDSKIKKQYQNLNIKFNIPEHIQRVLWKAFDEYNQHPEIVYKNFICTFNGSPHVARKLLVSSLQKNNWFNSNYSSKNFSYSGANIDGHLADFLPSDQHLVYSKFFKNTEEFNQTVYTFGHERFNHRKNIYTLEKKLTESFLHVVSETLATSYYPFVTEKFLYSVVTRGLFLAYAQPGWHSHLEKYYGFKLYNKVFDYRFDTIQNPVERLVELMSMISKFSVLSVDDWRDLYLIQQNEIEYNYDHYFSGNHLKFVQQHK